MLQIKNFTEGLERAEAFLRAKCEMIRTSRLTIHIKHTRARGCDLTGYYRWSDRRIVTAVKPKLRFPLKAAYSIAYAPGKTGRSLSRQKIWFEERFDSPDDLLVFVAGHEIWHFLCDSRQRPEKHDQETLANCNGFLWLSEFKRWRGPGHTVAPIPPEPPRPDLKTASTTAGGRRRTAARRPSHAAENRRRPRATHERRKREMTARGGATGRRRSA